MERYFVNQINDKLNLNKEQIHQIKDVMRNKIGDIITLINDGYFYEVKIVDFNPFSYEIIKKYIPNTELKLNITLLYCLSKGDKIEFAIQKASELGANKVVLVSSSRCVMKIKKQDEEKKLERYRKIALEASEQCGRAKILQVEGVIDFKDIDKYLSELNFIAYENERSLKLSKQLLENKKSVTILIGSEGGFSMDEVEYALSKSYLSLCLGNRILRSETAVLYALSLLSHYGE